MRPLLTVLGSAALTASVVLTLAWPRVTLADGDDVTKTVLPNGIRFGKLQISGTLDHQPDDTWVVHAHVENRGTSRATLTLDTAVRKTVSSPQNRAEPTPEAMWRSLTPVALDGGEATDLTLAIPAKVAARLTYLDAHPVGRWVPAAMGPGGGRIETRIDLAFWKG